MAKKFVRGITDIKTINNQDFDTNNVNDLLSDGTHNYIHRRKGDRSEEYHCLTDNIKTIKSTDTNLLTVAKDDGTNTASLTVKHDDTKQNKLTAGTNIEITDGNVINVIHSNSILDIGSKNILRNTSTFKTTRIGVTGTYIEGTWGSLSGGDGTIETFKLTDAPNDIIINGFRVNNNATGNKDLTQQLIPVTVGKHYTLSYYVRNATDSTTVKSLIRVNHSDTFTNIAYQSEDITSTAWVRKSFSFKAPQDAIRVQLGQTGSGSIEICGVQLEEGQTATAYSVNTWDIVEKLPQLISNESVIDIIGK